MIQIWNVRIFFYFILLRSLKITKFNDCFIQYADEFASYKPKTDGLLAMIPLEISDSMEHTLRFGNDRGIFLFQNL